MMVVPSRRGLIARTWSVFTGATARFSIATLLIAGGILGIAFWGSFNWVMEVANTEQFCISCHEMRDNVYKELQSTVHFSNRSGVRARCPDCHVPHDWFFKVRRKIQASNEVLHHILGTVNTPAKFETHRAELAERVWAGMKATDSRECRNCHSAEAMNPQKQSEASQVMRDLAGLTCIDCHRGIAHKLPKEEEEKKAE
jgi:cytochrome c-type protein NapC